MTPKEQPVSGKQARRFEGVTDLISEAIRIRTLGIHGDRTDQHVERTGASAWAPATDILAVGDDLVIRIELPGVDPAAIDLRLTHGVLTVSGMREDAGAPDAGAYLVRERYWGEFRRSIALPESTEPSQLTAEFSHGLVELTVAGGATGSAGSQIPLVDRSGETTRRTVEGESPAT